MSNRSGDCKESDEVLSRDMIELSSRGLGEGLRLSLLGVSPLLGAAELGDPSPIGKREVEGFNSLFVGRLFLTAITLNGTATAYINTLVNH